MDIITYALCKKNSSNSAFNESINVNENGEIEVITTLGNIYIDFETGHLKTNLNIFKIRNGYLISEV